MISSRNTFQRELVLTTVRKMRNHPTAEEIYQHVSKIVHNISRGTVYRNLGILAKKGEIQRITHLNSADRFDFELAPHYHLYCEECSRVYDVDMPYRYDFLEQASCNNGHIITGYELTFVGTCKSCNKNSAMGEA